jgi:hypothetical protein
MKSFLQKSTYLRVITFAYHRRQCPTIPMRVMTVNNQLQTAQHDGTFVKKPMFSLMMSWHLPQIWITSRDLLKAEKKKQILKYDRVVIYMLFYWKYSRKWYNVLNKVQLCTSVRHLEFWQLCCGGFSCSGTWRRVIERLPIFRRNIVLSLSGMSRPRSLEMLETPCPTTELHIPEDPNLICFWLNDFFFGHE